MAFVFDRKNWTVTDTETGAVLQSLGGSVGLDGERGGGERVEISCPEKWGENKSIAHLFIKKTFPDPEHMSIHWKLYRIYIPDELLAHEKEVITILEKLMKNFSLGTKLEELGEITTDFSEYLRETMPINF